MAWTEPKTNWNKDDFFNWQDYERIRQNIEYVADLIWISAGQIKSIDDMAVQYPAYSTYSSGTVTNSHRYLAPVFASNFNAIEDALQKIALTLSVPIPGKKTWRANKPAPMWTDFLRMEANMWALRLAAERRSALARRLPLRLTTTRGAI